LSGHLISLRYEVLERLGEGTFFQVSKARDKVMNRIVAVKTLQSVYAHDADFCDALRKAVPDVTNLTHPNIARVYEVSEEEGAPVLITEFVRGINLKERIRRIAPFTLSVAVDFAIAIGEALQHAHIEGLVHGDLRPQNVVVSPEGAVKVTDFGMAGVLAVSQQAAASNLGRAVHYQAPELAAGRPHAVSTDLYALGVILFEMLTGGLPYPGETPLIIAMKHQNEPVPSPRALNPGVPRSLEGIVMKALQKRPEERYRLAADMLNDLKSVRDALRFGKPLSWSPMESAPVAASAGDAGVRGRGDTETREMRKWGSGETKTQSPHDPTTQRPNDPIPAGAAQMSATRYADDRISPFLKLALGTVVMVIVVALIYLTAIWMVTFSKPPSNRVFPSLVGMKFDDAQRQAEKYEVRLRRQDEFNEEYDPDVIYRTEPETGRVIHPGRTIRVWVSKGSRMVWVPNVVNLSAHDAETKLKEAGLALGAVNRAFDNKIGYDFVISQNPRDGKRVERGQSVNIILSDGPNPAEQPETTDTGSNPTVNGPNESAGPSGESAGNTDNAGNDIITTQTLRIQIKRDGEGRRRVRVEYDDAAGTHTPVDDYYGEGEVIEKKVDVFGPKMTVRVYYGDDNRLKSEKTYTGLGSSQ
jgi:serine/threonine protein kinase